MLQRLLVLTLLSIMVADVPASAGPRLEGANVLAVSANSTNCHALRSPDGSDFDWNAISSNEDMKACLLQLAQNLKSPERMADWLQRQGFSDVGPYTGPSGRVYLNAIWNAERRDENIPFADNLGLFARWITKGENYSVQVRYEDGTPYGANAMHLLK